MRLLSSLACFAALCSIGCGPLDRADQPDHDEEHIGQYAQPLTVQDAVADGCSTSQVEGLSLQLVAQGNCIEPGAYAELSPPANVTFGSAVLPFMQEPGRDALAAALTEHAETSMKINSMFRTVAQQYLLYRWYQQGKCGIGLAAKPGSSNHESGLAIDLTPYSTWKPILESKGFSWLGASDPVHFDYKGEGTKNLKGIDVLAFQQLWNDNHPEDVITEDGLYGPQTEARLKSAPAEGFPGEVECDDGTPPDDPEPPADFSLEWSTNTLENVYSDGPSASLKDVFLSDHFEASLKIRNDTKTQKENVTLRLMGDGRLALDQGDAPPEDTALTTIELGNFDPAETKVLPLELIAQGYSVDGLKPARMTATIDEASAALSVDVYDVKRAEFNGERFEGWRAIGTDATQSLREGALVLEGRGPRLIARSANRPFTPQDTIEIRASRSGEDVESRALLLLVPADPDGVAMAIPFDLPADGELRQFVFDVPARAQSSFDAIEVIFFEEDATPLKPLSATLDYVRVDKAITGTAAQASDGCSVSPVGPGAPAPWRHRGSLMIGLLFAGFGLRRRRRPISTVALALLATGCTADFDEPVGTFELPLPKSVCADGPTVPGIDVSYYQDDIDWDLAAADEVKFAITRVNHGGFMDPKFDDNWTRIREVGLLRGAYQYFNPGGDPVEQAQTFIDKVGMLGPGDLPGVIDVESTDDESPETIATNVGIWLDLVEAGTGRKPIVYTAGYYWNDNVESHAFKDYPLWTAHYTSKCPYVPDGWEKWTIWQYTSSGSVDGISGNVDRNRFNGSLEQMHDFAADGYRAEIESLDYPSEMASGETGRVTIVLKNVGARAWADSTRFGTTEPRDRSSAFVSDDWLDPGRVFGFTSLVESGQSVEVSFDIVAPEVAGDYVETFNLVEEGVAWFSDINPGGGPADDVIALTIRVTGATSGPEDDDGSWDGAVVDLSLSGEVSASCSIATTPRNRRRQDAGWAWSLLFALSLWWRRRQTPRAS